MKRLVLLIFALSALLAASAQDTLSVAGRAKTAYDEKDYDKAISILEKEKDIQKANSLESAKLYYNLGNAYYKANELAKARLYYERATLLDPNDKEARMNIEFIVKNKLEDKIPVADTFFLNIWWQGVQNMFSSNGWTKIGIISFMVLMGCLAIFFFARHTTAKKISFYIGILFLAFVIFVNIFAYEQKNNVLYRHTAIVMTPSAHIYSAPDDNSTEIITLHAGTKISITKSDRNWVEVELDNGSIGWIQREKIEVI